MITTVGLVPDHLSPTKVITIMLITLPALCIVIFNYIWANMACGGVFCYQPALQPQL